MDSTSDVLRNNKGSVLAVAVSIGPYGAFLADGSEYTGDYGGGVTETFLMDFHRERLEILVDAMKEYGADILLFETIPSMLELDAILSLLQEPKFHSIPVWISFQAVSREGIPQLPCGSTLEEAVRKTLDCVQLSAVGLNCCHREIITLVGPKLVSQIRKVNELQSRSIFALCYPNRGGVWNTDTKCWVGKRGLDTDEFIKCAAIWKEMGFGVIGGCCQITPSFIKALYANLL